MKASTKIIIAIAIIIGILHTAIGLVQILINLRIIKLY